MGNMPNAHLAERAKAPRVYLYLRNQIFDERLSDGKSLPREQRLAESYRISRVTVRRTLIALRDAGLMEKLASNGRQWEPSIDHAEGGTT